MRAARLPRVFACGGQLEHHRGGRQQDERVHRDQREQRDQPCIAKHQAHQGHADHQRVAEGVGQCPCRAQRVEALQRQCGGIHDAKRHKVDAHGAKVQVLDVHRAHGAKQQRGREHHEHQVGQVLDRRRTDPATPPHIKADGDEQDDGDQRGENGRVQGGSRRANAARRDKREGANSQQQGPIVA